MIFKQASYNDSFEKTAKQCADDILNKGTSALIHVFIPYNVDDRRKEKLLTIIYNNAYTLVHNDDIDFRLTAFQLIVKMILIQGDTVYIELTIQYGLVRALFILIM